MTGGRRWASYNLRISQRPDSTCRGDTMNQHTRTKWCDRLSIAGTCFALIVIALGCAAELNATPVPRHAPTHTSPTSPSSQSGSAFVWAMVVDQSGICIAGATIYVVSGPAAGQTFVQDSDCDAWFTVAGCSLAICLRAIR
jgi:hypothetical protein